MSEGNYSMNLSLELALFNKCKSLEPKCNTFDGITGTEERKENLRATIKKIGPDVVFTYTDGKPVTLKQMWMRTYGSNWE